MKVFAHCIAIALGIAGMNAQAGYTAFSATGTSAGYPVSSTATFVTTPGQMEITLENTTAHTADAAQLLTGIRFAIIPEMLTILPLTDATAIPRDIASDGTYVDGPSQNIMGTWECSVAGRVYQLDFNPNAEFAIVGPADGESASSSGGYTANGSIEGNTGHNPFTARTAKFTFLNSRITGDTTIGEVSFIYNTGMTNVVPGTPDTQLQLPTVPEPSTIGFGVAILGFCGAVRRRKNQRSVV